MDETLSQTLQRVLPADRVIPLFPHRSNVTGRRHQSFGVVVSVTDNVFRVLCDCGRQFNVSTDPRGIFRR